MMCRYDREKSHQSIDANQDIGESADFFCRKGSILFYFAALYYESLASFHVLTPPVLFVLSFYSQ